MPDSYVAIIAEKPDFVPSDEQIAAGFAHMEQAGWIRREGDGWATAPGLPGLIEDPKPRELDGENVLTAGRSPVWSRTYPFLKGHAGLNLEPIACDECSSELAFDEVMDSLVQSESGEQEKSREELTVQCFHCGANKYVPDEEFGMSGGFARFEYRIVVETGRFMKANAEAMAGLQEAFGEPIKLIQVLVE